MAARSGASGTSLEKVQEELLKSQAEYYKARAAEIQENLGRRRAATFWRRTYDLFGEIEDSAAHTFADEIADMAAYSNDPITVRIHSMGGNVMAGLAIFDIIRHTTEQGVEVITYVVGHAASMGAVISQAGSTRRIAPNAWFMIHEPSSLVWGKQSDLKDEAKLLSDIHRQMLRILASRSNLTAREIAERCDRKEWWMPASEALKHGFFDEVV